MITKKNSAQYIISTLILVFVCACSNSPKPGTNYSSQKIAPPPNDGIYLGQHEWATVQPGDIAVFEEAIGRKAALFSPYPVMELDPITEWPLSFSVTEAEKAWQEGKIVIVHALEAYPHPGNNGFTIDNLLQGKYDALLKTLADQFRQFGKPMFFNTSREPNGILEDYFGGFGPNGDKSTQWALDNQKGLAEFDPSKFPNAELYSDLGDPEVSDGVERLIAAQRYYYNFFINKEGLTFLTFDTMGWAASYTIEDIANELGVSPGEPNYRLVETSYGFEYFYPGDDYVDWVSLTWYMYDYEGSVPTAVYLEKLALTMEKVKKVAPNKPVLFIELGFADGPNNDSNIAAKRIEAGLLELMKYPQVKAFAMWSQSSPKVDPFNFLIRPNTPEGDAFKKVIDDNPTYFHSCVYFSDGSQIPTCEP